MEDAHLCRSLSRKELQTWCKKLGLPARKSSSVMAESLLSYFQRNDVHWSTSSKVAGGRREASAPTSSAPAVQPDTALYFKGNALSDDGGLRSCHGHDGSKKSNVIGSRDLETSHRLRAFNQEGYGGLMNKSMDGSQPLFVSQCAGCSLSHKASPVTINKSFEGIPNYQSIRVTEGTCPSERDAQFVRDQPSFEFYVSSEEGIKICVDLDSRPSDWIKKYKNQVNLFENAKSNKTRSLHLNVGCVEESSKQIESSYLGNLDPGLTMNNCAIVPVPNSVLAKYTLSVVNHLDEGSKSLSPRQSSPNGLRHEASACLQEVAEVVPLEPNLDVENGLSCNNVQSCNKKGFSSNMDSVVNDAQTEKTACNFGVNLICDGLADRIASERQASKHDDEACDNSVLQNGCFIENGSFAFQNSMGSRSAEILLSEAGNYHEEACYDNGKFLDPVDSQHSLGTDQDVLAYSRNNETCGNYMSICSEERGWSNNANGPASSVCSQVDESVEKTCLIGETAAVDGGHRRKPLHSDKGSESGSGRCDARVLRSTNHSAVMLPRRSTRLVAK